MGRPSQFSPDQEARILARLAGPKPPTYAELAAEFGCSKRPFENMVARSKQRSTAAPVILPPSAPFAALAAPELSVGDAQLVRALVARKGLHEFMRIFWPEAVPQTFLDNWHLHAMCEHLEAVARGEIKRLVINVPPGHSKSLVCGVFWPAWLWTLKPTTTFLTGSFDQSLLNNQSEKMISIILSELYQQAFPGVKLAKKSPAMREFKNTAGGFRFNTSPEGKGTGRHVDGILIDDPIKPQDAILGRDAAFAKVDSWFDGTLQTRVREWIVLIMQRVHSRDLAGRCIDEGYETLILPARQVKRPMWIRDPRKEPGELLWPELFPEERVAAQELKLRNEASAQLQQDPTPATGGFVEEAWTRLEWIEPPSKGVWAQSWDFSAKGSEESHSKVSGQLWCRTKEVRNLYQYLSSLDERLAKVAGSALDKRIIPVPDKSEHFLLIDWVGGHWNYVQSKAQFTAAQTRPFWPNARKKLVELKANGPAIILEMKEHFHGIIGVEPEGTKEERYKVHTEKWEVSQVVYPPGPRTVEKKVYLVGADVVREEHIKFPRYLWDDHVDTSTQALDELANANSRYRENLAKIARGV